MDLRLVLFGFASAVLFGLIASPILIALRLVRGSAE